MAFRASTAFKVSMALEVLAVSEQDKAFKDLVVSVDSTVSRVLKALVSTSRAFKALAVSKA